jgi:hydrogenase nickel incorporation protein HypA/HybF
MHEMAIAQSVLAAISAEAKKQKAKPIAAKISCGVLNGINDDALRFAFEAISKGTVCEGVKLDIKQKPIQARCKKCSETFAFDLHEPNCPKCRCDDFELLPDEPLMLEEVEFDDE